MTLIEVTGQPCSGKSSILVKNTDHLLRQIKNNFPVKIIYFFLGANSLGRQRLKVLFQWSLAEKAPILFKLNIFFNCVSKFGLFYKFKNQNRNKALRFIVDEGISHIPFLFLETDTKIVIDFISKELQMIRVYFLQSPEQDVIQIRLLSRGHKRLKFMPLSNFTNKTQAIEKVLLSQYPSLCKKFEVFEDVASIK